MMTLHSHFDRLPAFLSHLELIGADAQKDAFINEVMEQGGTWVIPRPDPESSHLVEISLHGVSAWGDGEDEAIRNWKKAARRQMAGNEMTP